MMRLIFAVFILIHGLIHLLGFAKAFKIAHISNLSQPISKPTGVLWLSAALLMVIAAISLFWKRETWWTASALAISISQLLITVNWSDARFGTIPNIIILFASLAGYGEWNFNSMVKNEIPNFIPKQSEERQTVSEQTISPLPPVVQKWLKRSNIIGKEIVHTVHLRQTGEMRTTRDGRWRRFEAEQFNSVDKPGFLWIAHVRMAPMLHLAGRDKYENGKGHMLIKLLSLFPVVNGTGPKIDQGSLVRYMAEIVWFPTAALSDYITWEGINSHAARATMTYGDVSASCIFEFTPDGDVRSLEAMRYYERNKGATLEKWQVQSDPTGFKEYEGIRIPANSTVTWKLKEGDFTWLKLEIIELTYNNIAKMTRRKTP